MRHGWIYDLSNDIMSALCKSAGKGHFHSVCNHTLTYRTPQILHLYLSVDRLDKEPGA